MTGGGGRDSTSRVGPTPLDTVLALLCGGGGSFPSHVCSSIETQQAASLSGWRPPLPQITEKARQTIAHRSAHGLRQAVHGGSVRVAMRLPSQLHIACCTELPHFFFGQYCSPSSDHEWCRMRIQAHSIWTALVQPPSLLQLAKRYILPTGQHLDSLIQEGAAPPLQFLQFVQDSVGEKTWADAQWKNLLPADLWVDTSTGKRGQREWLNGDEVQVAMDFIRNHHGVTSESCCPFRIASVFAFDKLSGSEATVDSETWAALDTDWAAVDDTLSRPGFGVGSRRVFHKSECEDLIFPINVRRKDTSGVHFGEVMVSPYKPGFSEKRANVSECQA